MALPFKLPADGRYELRTPTGIKIIGVLYCSWEVAILTDGVITVKDGESRHSFNDFAPLDWSEAIVKNGQTIYRDADGGEWPENWLHFHEVIE